MIVVCRIDANSRQIILHNPETDSDERYGTVMLQNAEFGAGMVRGELVETFVPVLPARHLKKRAYFNRNKTQRYIDKATGRVLRSAKVVYMTGNSVLYDGEE